MLEVALKTNLCQPTSKAAKLSFSHAVENGSEQFDITRGMFMELPPTFDDVGGAQYT